MMVACAILCFASARGASPAAEFDAAAKAGKPLTAEAAYRAVLRDGEKVAPIIHFRAAMLAEASGQPTLVRDRLNLFVRQEQGWTPEVERALWTLTASGDDIEQFRRLSTKVPADSSLWRTGYNMLSRFRQANRHQQVIQMTDALIAVFKEKSRREAAFERLWDSWASNRNSYPVADLHAFLKKNRLPELSRWRDLVWDHFDALGADWVLETAAATGKPMDGLVERALGSLNNDTWQKTTNATLKAKIEDVAKAARSGAKVWLASTNYRLPSAYALAAMRMPKFHFQDVTTNNQSTTLAKVLERVVNAPFNKNEISWCESRRWEVISAAFNWGRLTPQGAAQFIDAHPDLVPVDWLCRWSSLGDTASKVGKDKSLAPLEAVCQKFPKQADSVRAYYVNTYAQYGDRAAVEKAVGNGIANSVVSFDAWWVLGALNSVPKEKMAIADKIAVLKKGFAASGWNNGWTEMEKAVKNHRNWELPKSKEYADFIASLNKAAKVQDPLRRAAWEMSQAKDAATAAKVAEEAMKAVPAKLPDPKFPKESAAFKSIVWRYIELVRNGKPEECEKFCLLVEPKVSASYDQFNWIWNIVNRAKSAAAWRAHYNMNQANFGDNDSLGLMTVAKDAEKPYDGIDMKLMSPYRRYEYFRNNWGALKAGPAKNQFLCDYIKAGPLGELGYKDGVNQVLETIKNALVNDETDLAAKLPLKELADGIFAKTDADWNGQAHSVIIVASAAKRTAEVLPAYYARINKMDESVRAQLYIDVPQISWHTQKTGWRGIVNDREDAEKKTKDEFGPMLETQIIPALKAVSDRKAPTVKLWCGSILERLKNYREWNNHKDHKNEKAVANVDAFYTEYARLALAGAQRDVEPYREGPLWAMEYGKALAASNTLMLAKTAQKTGSRWSWWIGPGWMHELMKKTSEAGFYEPCFLLVNSLPGDTEQGVVAAATKLRSEISSKIPGIYPVGEKDPSYPLYVAAEELSRKNPERAWQILQDPKLHSVFEREALKLPPEFVIWGVEQLRMARGDKDALLVKARNIATALLAQESKITPEVAAAMILSRAEGYRDQQNFEAAKLEYQSVRDNPNYHKTSYGKKAMFRAVDLQIISGNAQAVESTLEYWLSQNDREIQAEAHYFMAKIAFDRKDYDETIKQLRQVFAINYTHTEGRFLQGQWKLATNSEVDDTDVLIGDLSERNLIRPGNQLTVTVQDANLSVAGGGASIPVIVTAQPGGDKERINLYPTSRDPSNFKGLIEVKLGKPVISNLVLEVSGKDTVSYVIDPAFLQERGLPLNEPKRLKIVDDAKVAIGAGAPRTDEKKTEKGVKNLLADSDASEDSGVTRKLRPGNPLYVVVQDRDCSYGQPTDSVRVSVETSSGDKLQNYVLQEEAPYSGVFRGKIETSLPPPRAFASDTAAGMNPGDVINKNKSTGWKSLPDGQPGKWFEVDTMGSHLFSKVTLDTPSAGDIKTIRLVGRMGSKQIALGQLPATMDISKVYLRTQQQYDGRAWMMKSVDKLRAFCRTDKAARAKIVQKIEYRVLHKHDRQENQTAFYSGPFVVPEKTDSLRFRLSPVSTSKMALNSLWVALAIDGEEVFSGQGPKLQNAILGCDIAPGCHQFELAVVAAHKNDQFDLLWEPEGLDPAPIPAEWFDEEKHPNLKEFVKDHAKIEKTDTGFTATFANPVRLRSLRWEFADVKSPDVAITRMTAVNAAGETFLPVENDFSTSQNNSTLEVAPGDRIYVRYEDERTSSGEKKIIERDLNSSFNDARVRFIFEEVDEKNHVMAYDAFRFQPGDSLVLCVEDPDCDITDEADKIQVTVKNAAGKEFKKTLVEYRPSWMGYADGETGMHSGVFMGTIKTCDAAKTNAPANVLRCPTDDLLTVSYDDRENTNPGVPCIRTAKIFAARPSKPALVLFNAKRTREVDTSPDAKALLERIRRRPGNENVDKVYREVLTAEAMDAAALDTTNAVPVGVAASIPIRVIDRSRARFARSKVMVKAVAESELAKAAAEGREPDSVTVPLYLGGSLAPYRLGRSGVSTKEAQGAGVFNGVIQLSLGPIDPNIEVPEDAPPVLCVSGSDKIQLTVLDDEGAPVIEKTIQLVSNATLQLTDSTFGAERQAAHVGECFFISIDDADRDLTEDPDQVRLMAFSTKTGVKRPVVLTETMPHSGVFTGRLRPVIFAPNEVIPSVATGGVASANEVLTEERFAVGYGDKVVFKYKDMLVLPGTEQNILSVTGSVFRGSNGDVRLFSKRFADRDTAVLVQFRLAECLFEQAKEHRKLKQPEKSAAAIDEGKFILEEALKNYPDSSHVVQGEFLLANLYQELATEQKDAGDMDKATPLYQEALSRFSQILGTWPEGEYAARSQYHKALCLEMLKDYNRASEEYVKMTYLYPESELVGEATIRLATYYYTQEKRFDISGHIYKNFQERFPQHEKAARALFMAGSCYIKQAETLQAEIDKAREEKKPVNGAKTVKISDCYRDAVDVFVKLVETYRDGSPKLKAQALYWAGDVCCRRRDYAKAYHYLKQTVFEYPETEWARRARGLLLQEERSFKEFQ